MDIFLRLVLAHLIGDFPLQTEKIYTLKQKGTRGVVPHVLIVTLCFIVLLWPYLHLPIIWSFIVFTFIVHLLQDITKLRIADESKNPMLWYILDQASHIFAIMIIFLTQIPDLPLPRESSNFFINLYINNELIWFLIAWIVTSYNGHWMLTIIRQSYLNKHGVQTTFEKWYGIIERSMILTCFVPQCNMLMAIPFILIFRLLIGRYNKNTKLTTQDFGSMTEIILNGALAILTGIIFYIIL